MVYHIYKLCAVERKRVHKLFDAFLNTNPQWNYNQMWTAPKLEGWKTKHTKQNGIHRKRCIQTDQTTPRRPLTCHQDEKSLSHKDQVCHTSNASHSTGICRWEIPFSYQYTFNLDSFISLPQLFHLYPLK